MLRSLDAMQSAGMPMPQGIEPKKIFAVYHYALSGVSGTGLSVATQKLIRGDYAANPNVLLGTIPKPPVLAALAKAEARMLRAELARKRDMLVALAPRQTAQGRSEESRRRVRAKLEAFRRGRVVAGGVKVEERVVMPHGQCDALRLGRSLPGIAAMPNEQRDSRNGQEGEAVRQDAIICKEARHAA